MRKLYDETRGTFPIVAASIAAAIGFVVVASLMTLVVLLVPKFLYRPYPASALRNLGRQELVYPGSKTIRQSTHNPTLFDQYEVASYIIELPKTVDYRDYLLWLFENTAPNGRWIISDRFNPPWTTANLKDYPDQTFRDDTDLAQIDVNSQLEFLATKSYAKSFTIRQKGVTPDIYKDPYIVYQGKDGGLILWVELTVWTNSHSDASQRPPLSSFFARIPQA